MKKIGITQRVEMIGSYGERRDCLDQNWTKLLLALSLTPVPLSNTVADVAGYVDALGLSGVILSGGNDVGDIPGAKTIAPERDRFEAALIDLSSIRGMPLLGICRGMEMINAHLRGRFIESHDHVRTRHIVRRCAEAPGYWPERFDVNSYHDFAIPADGLAAGLIATAVAHDGTIEALRHAKHPVTAVMWHPERETEFVERDFAMLRDVFSL